MDIFCGSVVWIFCTWMQGFSVCLCVWASREMVVIMSGRFARRGCPQIKHSIALSCSISSSCLSCIMRTAARVWMIELYLSINLLKNVLKTFGMWLRNGLFVHLSTVQTPCSRIWCCMSLVLSGAAFCTVRWAVVYAFSVALQCSINDEGNRQLILQPFKANFLVLVIFPQLHCLCIMFVAQLHMFIQAYMTWAAV